MVQRVEKDAYVNRILKKNSIYDLVIKILNGFIIIKDLIRIRNDKMPFHLIQ